MIRRLRINKYWIPCIYSCLSYPARKPLFLAPYYIVYLWHVRLYHIFSTLSHKRHNFRWKKMSPKITRAFLVSPTMFVSEHLYFKKISNSSYIYAGLHVKCPFFLSELNQTWISQRIFQKSSNIKFNGNPSSGVRVVPCEQTDGQTWQS